MTNIEQLLPHREPFLFVDRIESATKEQTVGYRTFDEDRDFFFKGHFPGYPLVPGVVLVETMAQCGGAGVKTLGIYPEGTIFFLAAIDRVKFRRQVRPGEEVKITVENLRISPKTIKQRGTVHVADELAGEAEWLCIIGIEGSETNQA